MGQERAVIFDVYETLVTEFDPDWDTRPSTAQRLELEEKAFADAWARLQTRRLTGQIRDYIGALHEVGEALGRDLDEDTVQELNEERVARHRTVFKEIEAPILQMLQRLRPEVTRLGIIGNASFEEIAAWPGSALPQFFDHVIFSCDVGLAKPDERICRLACERLGLPPESSVFIGDGASDELAGATNAGLKACWATWFLRRFPKWQQSDQYQRNSGRHCELKSPCDVLQALKGNGTLQRGPLSR